MDDESKFKTALGMCQMYLRPPASGSSTFHTPLAIQQAVEAITTMSIFSGVDGARLSAELEMRLTVYAPFHRTLGMDTNHMAWLPSKRGQIEWRYWDRYRLYLEERLPDAGIRSLERVTDDILARLEDPARPGDWDRRGLVMGHVQSGKTANYCGLICKAADAGYKVIIVLSGIHNNLRSQTQIRLDEGFLGFTSEPRTSGSQQIFPRAGVGLLDGTIHANTGTNRTQTGDFNTTVANQFGISPGGLPLLFVVKKNVSVLNNIFGWIQSYADARESETDRRFVRNVPVLVIDDEADLASVDTRQQMFDEYGNPDLEHEPTKINKLIRKILQSFGKVAYVGYTATPFANIFIHDRGVTRELGADLFPRSFIVHIPPPSNYLSPARVFGIKGEEDTGLEAVESLPLVRIVSDHARSNAIDEQHGWMPPKLIARTGHIPLFNGEHRVPPSLIEAMMGFILTVAVRRLREHGPHHNSMLIHVIRYTAVQNLVAEQVQLTLRDIVQRLRYGDGGRTPTIQNEFKDLWFRDFVPTSKECHRIAGKDAVPPLHEWEKVAPLLREVTDSIHVKTINGSAGDVLEYEEHRVTGLNAIVIGGDKLSRGLTLEGLSVSYFLRASQMYDTLMQMGRWFGYRDKYLDLCRLYTTGELLGWFTHIAAASEELQRDFQYMAHVHGTPEDFGLKVRSHPVMLVTSAVKMRHGTEMTLSFSGDISETICFYRDPVWIGRNFSAVENWLAALAGRPTKTEKSNGHLWHDVGAREILDLISAYSTHEGAYRANTTLLTRYIKAKVEQSELQDWKVLLCSSGLKKAQPAIIAGLDIGLIERAPYPKEQRTEDPLTIRQLMSRTDELVDLTDEQIEAARKLTVDNWKDDPDRKPEDPPPKDPGRREARQFRPKTNGLLLLYPLNPSQYVGLPHPTKPIIGLAISFPTSDKADPISYTVNNIYTLRGGDDESF
ncbi:Z1 domain-containing protein [Candidatus Nitrospira nitrificans]|uniref:Putative endonuclease Z1 domain-containing protein n=1 Tax=Candidatus Nitrospira nitrificans TaxID=1742973 RepID=A0A0S4LF01_9BACT|nr:Z1 domain-containing protein [Candidatus Nitrospira nitrificans]CUS34532.1 conserved hypothetical protein [Candidatus Nitrospira nitrificans]